MSISFAQYELQQIKGNLAKVRRLIIIARPADLPALKHDDATETMSKKKLELPLFGKKRTFGLSKSKTSTAPSTITTINTPITSTNIPVDDNTMSADNERMDSVEECDDDDGRVKSQHNETVTTNANDNDRQTLVDADKTVPVNATIDIVPDIKKPASLPIDSIDIDGVESIASCSGDNIISSGSSTKNIETDKTGYADEPKRSDKPAKSIDIQCDEAKVKAANQTQHKSRNRNSNRARGQQQQQTRTHIDIDDDEEDKSPNKFANWLPPQNQSGDGITDLNSRFGY